MNKGPIFNDNKKAFTTRDSLGIDGVATSMADKLCPIVNTVTPRAFYWPFMVWLYYDYLKNSNVKDKEVDTFEKTFLKRIDYNFVLSQLIHNREDEYNLVAKDNVGNDYRNNPDGPYKFNQLYFKAKYGGMQYYNGGCYTLKYIVDKDEDENSLKFPHPTVEGEQMAEAFEEVIKNTKYYQEYRLNDKPVPKDVLKEFGEVINLDLDGFDECKDNLRRHLFETKENYYLKLSSEYVKLFVNEFNIDEPDTKEYRNILFDAYSPRGNKKEYPKVLSPVVKGWEILIGRMYFTLSLQMIWNFMLKQLSFKSEDEEFNIPMNLNDWVGKCFDESSFDYDINDAVESIMNDCNYSFEIREEMIDDARLYKKEKRIVSNALNVMLSIYNRFDDRDDLGDEKNFLTWGNESDSISLSQMMNTVEEYKTKSVKDFLEFVMKNWLVNQHIITASEKALQSGNGKDGFFIEVIDGIYYKKQDYKMDYQGIRLTSLTRVMRDLDML